MKKPAAYLVLILILNLIAQKGTTQRLHDHNTIGWYNTFITLKLNNKWSVHTEYQWRRDNWISDWQQSLLRTGINYNPTPRVQFRMGYAWIETFPYGDIPINAMGKDFTEHRVFEMAQLSHKEGKIDFSLRFMLEQRWIGRYTSIDLKKEDDFVFLNRMRYMFRMQIPLKGKEVADKTPYLAAYDEAMLGFGENIGVNVFDQNRFGILLGYRWNKNLRLELGYLNQLVQFGRLVNNQSVFQHNNGVILNLYLNADLNKN